MKWKEPENNSKQTSNPGQPQVAALPVQLLPTHSTQVGGRVDALRRGRSCHPVQTESEAGQQLSGQE